MRENKTLTGDQQTPIFQQAVSIKMEEEQQLRANDDTNSEEIDSVVVVKMLADLQEHQDREAANIMKDLDQKVILCLFLLTLLT